MGSSYSSIPKKIVDSLGAHLDRITVEGSAEASTFPINDYCDLSNSNPPSVVVSDDTYVVEYLKCSGVESINTLSLLDYLLTIKRLTPDDWISSIEQFCGFGISGPSISYDHVFQIIESYLRKNPRAELLSTNFKYVFDAMFPIETDFKSAFNRISRIFSELLNRNQADIDISALKELLSVWLVRFPQLNKIDFIARWFVLTATNTDVKIESSLIKVSKGQSLLWRMVKVLTLQEGEQHTVKEILVSIINVILKFDQSEASDIFDIIKTSFVEGSAEYDTFVQIYSDSAISLRLGQK